MNRSPSVSVSRKPPELLVEAKTGRVSFEWRALGSPCRVLFYPKDEHLALGFRDEVVTWVANFEEKYSRFKDTSLLSEINRMAGKDWVEIDRETEALFELCDSLNYTTQGVLDPTSLPLIQLWYKVDRLPSVEQVLEAKSLVGWHKVERESGRVKLPQSGMAIDLGGFGKEYAVDKVAEIADRFEIASYLIDFGRDIRVKGTPPQQPCWHIAIENPNQSGKPLLGIGLSGGAIAASGDYRNYFMHNGTRYGHIIDPKTGYPVSNRTRSVHVLAGTCLEAGIHSTSAFILGIPDGLDLLNQIYGLEGLIITEDNQFQTKSFFQYVVS